jgi:translocation and assembly module TamB
VTEPALPKPSVAAAPKSRRRWWKYLFIVAAAGSIALLAGLWYITTDSFQALVRRRVVAEIERITGGRAEVGTFHTVPFHMQVEVRNITVHGREGAGEVPLAHADRLIAQVKVISFLRTEFGFDSLVLEHPVVHIMFAADGSSNVPSTQRSGNSSQVTGQAAVQQLFALSIDHLSVHNGELLWQDRNIPLDFDVADAGLRMDYSFLRRRYEGNVAVGKVDTRLLDFRPFAWMTQGEFSLGTDSAEVKSVRWSSGRSRMEASGRIADFRNPHIEASYDALIDLGEAAAIAHRNDLRAGVAQFKGRGTWSLDQFATNGAVVMRDLGWQDNDFVVKNVGATSEYSVTDVEITLSKLQGKALGGSFTGDAQLDNWLHSAPAPLTEKSANNSQPNPREELPEISAAHPHTKNSPKVRTPLVQSGAVHLRVRDISAADVVAAVNAAGHPFGRFHPVGLGSGTLEAFWRGSVQNAEIPFTLEVVPPAHVADGELPVTARARGTYRRASESLELAEFNLSTPASRMQAAGVLAQDSTLHLSVTTSNLDEWRPLIAALRGPIDVPFNVNGSATFTGVASGSLESPTLSGTLAANDFDFTLPATSRTPEQPVNWDSLTVSVQLSPHNLVLRGGSLQRGDTSADFDASAILQNGQLTATSPLTANANLHHIDVASTAVLAGFDYPVTGVADVTVQVSGTRGDPRVVGQIHAANASAYGEAIAKLDADLHIEAGETSLSNIQLLHQDATITGSAAYRPSVREFNLDLTGKNFDLSRIPQIHLDPLPVGGRADFTLQGSGSLDAPALNATVHVRELTLDQEVSGGLDLEASTKGGQLHLSGHSQFPHGTLNIEGDVQMRDGYPAVITAHMDHLDLDALWQSYLGNQLTGHSAVGGTIIMKGPLRYPRQWTLDGDVADLALDVEYAKLHNQGPIHFTYAQQAIHIDQAHLVGEGTDVTGHGSINFVGARDIDLTADGQIDLKLLNSLDPDLAATGAMSVNLTVGGTLSEPQPQGNIRVANGAMNYAGMPSGLSEMNGSLAFTREHVHIEKLTARTGGGTLDLKGDATTYNHQLSFNLTAIGKDVRLRYPPGVSSTANEELHWVGTRSSSTISGDIMVTKLAVMPGFDFGSYLERSRQSASIAPANSPLYGVKLDIAVHTAAELQMKTAVARLSGDADLKLRGSVARPSVLGRADILEGDATFNGIKFRLERGDITFANPVAIEPQVNLQATTHVRNYDLDVTITGTPEHLSVNYRSEPPLPKSDIIALLALGRTSEESEQLQQQSGQTPFTDEATALIISQALNSTVSSRMQKIFGVSRIKIDPQGLTTETNPTARGPQVTIEQQFANNLSLTYSTNVSQSSQQIIQGEYYFNRNISAVGTRDQNGVVSFDVRIRRRKQ